MDAQKTRAAVEAMAGHFAALNEAKEDCKANVDGVLGSLVAESADPITRDDKRNLKRAAKALAKQTAATAEAAPITSISPPKPETERTRPPSLT